MAGRNSTEKEQFCRELQDIIVLLQEHSEWRYKYPSKYESVRDTAVHQFLILMARRTGITPPVWITNIPIEELKTPSPAGAALVAGKIRRDLVKVEKKRLSPEKKKVVLKAIKKWQHICNILRNFR